MSGDEGGEGREDPIFIHGVLPRSGTNFLYELLLLHPRCGPAIEPVHEDLFLDRSDHLLAFAEAAERAWDPAWGTVTDAVRARLLAALGDALISFLWTDRDRRLVTKSPSVVNLERFFMLFPRARLLVLVRDGRAVARSAVETFGWTLERAARAWAAAADEVDRFRRAHPNASRWRLVRYEDLVLDLDHELPEILRFLGLDVGEYDLDAARRLPVRGSSHHFGAGRSSVHWEPVARDAGFDPTDRWRTWDRDRIDRVEWVAGRQLRALGYPTTTSGPRSMRRTAGHLASDVSWSARRALERARTAAAEASSPFRHRSRVL